MTLERFTTCPTCKYDLQGLSGKPWVTCPECGQSCNVDREPRWRPRMRYLGIGLLPSIVTPFVYLASVDNHGNVRQQFVETVSWLILAACVVPASIGLVWGGRSIHAHRAIGLAILTSIVFGIANYGLAILIMLAMIYTGLLPFRT